MPADTFTTANAGVPRLSAETYLPSAPNGGTIVFDLDGTLVDSVRDLLPALNFAIAQEGVAPIELADIGKVVGKGALKMIETAFSLNNRALDDELHHRLLAVFLDRYEKYVADETVFFDGCLDLLDRLSQQGWKLAVCTNKYAHLADLLLERLGERSRFDVLTGGDTFEFKKPDGRHISETVKLAGGTPVHSIMVGDSYADIAGAKDAGIPVIAVDFGYTDVPVSELNPDRVISSYDEFDAALTSLLKR